MLVRVFMAKKKTVIMPHWMCSSDLAPADVLLFPKLKRPLKGKRFAMIEDIKDKSKQELLAIPKKRDSEVLLGLEHTLA